MEEEKQVEEIQDNQKEIVDDGKIHFPISGVFIIIGLVTLMIICVILILVFRK